MCVKCLSFVWANPHPSLVFSIVSGLHEPFQKGFVYSFIISVTLLQVYPCYLWVCAKLKSLRSYKQLLLVRATLNKHKSKFQTMLQPNTPLRKQEVCGGCASTRRSMWEQKPKCIVMYVLFCNTYWPTSYHQY